MRTIHILSATLLLWAGLHSARAQDSTPAPSGPYVQNTMAQRMQACVVCHGKDGRATNQGYFPRIAGKPAGYLYNQLQSFKTERRKYEAMNHLVQNMSDDYLRDIAKYFAELDLPYQPAQRSQLTQNEQRAAENLVLHGAPERKLPACIACHGQQMAGKQPAMPGLLTLPVDYLVARLGAWRSGQTEAKAPDCMADIAKRLTLDEVSVVAKWLSAQTLPSGAKPAPQSAQALPIRCGSTEQ